MNNYKNLVEVNKFWVDFANYVFEHKSTENFVTDSFIWAVQNHVEALAVISLMDLSQKEANNYNLNAQPGRKIQI